MPYYPPDPYDPYRHQPPPPPYYPPPYHPGRGPSWGRGWFIVALIVFLVILFFSLSDFWVPVKDALRELPPGVDPEIFRIIVWCTVGGLVVGFLVRLGRRI